MRIAAFLRLSSGKGILNTWPRLDLFIPSHFHKVLPSINDSSFNGVQKGQVTDSAFASGNPGMGMATGPCYQESEILLRGNISAHSAKLYEVNVGDRNDSSSYINIVRWNGPLGNFTTLLYLQSPSTCGSGDSNFGFSSYTATDH